MELSGSSRSLAVRRVFGSHICFYSDATVITSAACGCDNFKHALSQMPYGFIAAGISAILFAIMGFVMA